MVAASRVPAVTGAALIIGVVAITAGMTVALPESPTLGGAKLDLFAVTDARSFVATAAQIASAAGFLAFGVVAAWITGREFVEGTIEGRFARPIPLSSVATAKLVVLMGWALAVTAALIGASATAILALGYDVSEAVPSLARLAVAMLLTAAMSTIAALIATITRGYLASIGVIVGLIAVGQVSVLTGAGSWVPIAAPALWALGGSALVPPAALAGTLGLGLVSACAVVIAWRYLRVAR